MKLSRRLRPLLQKHSLRTSFKIAALLALVATPAATRAAQFTYTPPATPDTTNWSQGTAGHFNAVPVSAATTQLTFGLNTTTALAAGSYTSNNDIATGLGTNGGFLLNILDLNGLGSTTAGTPATINITGTALEFATNGTLAPVINLNGLNGTGGLVYNVATNLALDNNTTFTGNGTAAFNFAGVLSGAGTLTKNGTSTLTLTGANTYTGATTVNAGIVALSGANGSLALSASPITITGGEFQLNNTTAAGGVNANRLDDTQTVALRGGLLDFLGSNDATNATETIGAVTVAAGRAQSTIAVQPQTGGTGTNTLTMASLTRAAGQGVILVDGVGLGSAAPSAGIGNLFATTAPTLVGTTAAGVGITAGTNNTQIVPFLVGNVTGTGTGTLGGVGNANTFVTYNATTGFRPLNPTDEFTLNAITATNNTYLTTGTTAATATAAINSLVFNGGNLTINTGQTLTNTSGAMLFAANGTVAGSSSTVSTLAFGTAEAIFTVNSGATATFSDATSTRVDISGTGGLTKNGAGTLLLKTPTSINANQALTGAININQGTIDAQATGGFVFPAADTITVASGATMEYQDHAGGTNINIANPHTLNGVGAGGVGALFLYNSAGFQFTSASTFNLASDSVIRYDPAVQTAGTTFAGVISGTGGLTLVGASSGAGVPLLIFNKANTYGTANNNTVLTNSGTTQMTLELSTVTNVLPSGTTVTFGGAPAGVTGASFNGPVNLTLDGISQTVAGLQVASGATGTYRVIGNSATGSTLTISNAAADTFAGILGGGGTNNNNLALAKSGAGVLTLTGTNTFANGVTISAGTLNINADAALGTAPATAATKLTFSGSSTLQAGAATITLAATRNITINSTFTGSFDTNGNSLTVNGVIGGAGALRKVGAGTLFLNGDNSFSGAATFSSANSGAIRLSTNNGLGTGTKVVDLATASGSNTSVLELTNNITTPATTSLTTGGRSNGTNTAFAFLRNVSGSNTFGGNISINNSGGGYAVDLAGGTLTLSGTIKNAANNARGLVFLGSGNAIISGLVTDTSATVTTQMIINTSGSSVVALTGAANDYTGATLLTAGTLNVGTFADAGTVSSIGKGSATPVAADLQLNSGTLQYTGTTDQSTNRLFQLGTTVAIDSSSPTNAALKFTGTGALAYLNTTARTLTLTGSSAGANTITPIIADATGATSVTKTGVGSWTLAGANTYSGATTVTGGTLGLTDGGSFGTGTVNNNATVAFSNTGALSVGNVINGTGVVVQNGAGNTTLTGNNAFGGGTTINAGTLTAASTTGKALGGTTGIVINSGTLAFNQPNQVNAAAPITVGTAAPTTGGLSAAAGANQGSASTVVAGTPDGTTSLAGLGALTLNGPATLAFSGPGTTLVFGVFTANGNVLTITGYTNGTATADGQNSGAAGDDRLVFNNGGGAQASVNSFDFGSGPGVGVNEIALDGNFYEVFGAVPEPSTWVGGLLMVSAIGFTQRRRLGALLGTARQS